MPMQATTTTPLFSATLRPDRSLRATGGWVSLVIAAIVSVPFLIAVPEFLVPGLAAFALAVGGLVGLSLRQARRDRVSQQIIVWADQIEITLRGPGHERVLRRFSPRDVRLVLTRDDNERTTAMHLRHGAEEVELGAFLAPDDKSSFAREFGRALRRARQSA
ncbi:DUF2244 domain-containing protein [Devosia sp. FJ2-5-3]|jgi:uncharacterized membrane protein|uniref:DUF2244 domain-containing protein n=1 Tax=Devosia sp. FJ2-5-3 TaxID=2976680 RepID=UPI0023D7F483|nr:DUF2244 domain-containing protein [Devosia sp. FJ2-5-3]WEJ58611.1 DUF2244 domain-containing protein [Devosia sp. FJ2-5-3]